MHILKGCFLVVLVDIGSTKVDGIIKFYNQHSMIVLNEENNQGVGKTTQMLCNYKIITVRMVDCLDVDRFVNYLHYDKRLTSVMCSLWLVEN